MVEVEDRMGLFWLVHGVMLGFETKAYEVDAKTFFSPTKVSLPNSSCLGNRLHLLFPLTALQPISDSM